MFCLSLSQIQKCIDLDLCILGWGNGYFTKVKFRVLGLLTHRLFGVTCINFFLRMSLPELVRSLAHDISTLLSVSSAPLRPTIGLCWPPNRLSGQPCTMKMEECTMSKFSNSRRLNWALLPVISLLFFILLYKISAPLRGIL